MERLIESNSDLTRQVVRELVLAGIRDDASADELHRRIVSSPAFGVPLAIMIAREAFDAIEAIAGGSPSRSTRRREYVY